MPEPVAEPTYTLYRRGVELLEDGDFEHATEPLAETDNDVELAPEIVSPGTASASRQSLAALSAVVVRSEPEQAGNTLEGLVRELLRPMLRDWLDGHLPDMVEELVSREIARITGKAL